MEQVGPNLLSMPELFSVRATITRKFPDVSRIMNHFKETGFIYKSFDIASGDYDQETTGWTKKDLEKYDNNFFKYVDKIFSDAGKDSLAEIIETADKLNRLQKRKPLYSACRMSRALMVVTPEGDIFPCYRLSERVDFTIGNVFNGINEQKKQSLYPKLSFNRDICRDCWARYLCGGGCAAESFIKYGHDYKPCETVCHARKISWKWHIWLYLKFHTENPLFLNSINFFWG